MALQFVRYWKGGCHLPDRFFIDVRIVFYGRKGETGPANGRKRSFIFRNIDYVRRCLARVILVAFSGYRHFPVNFGIDPHIALYGRNGGTGPIDGEYWNLIFSKYRLRQNAPAHFDSCVI